MMFAHSGGSKRRSSDRVIVGVRGPRRKRRQMECSSPLNAPTKHPASVRVFNQPLDPKNPMDGEKFSRPDGVFTVMGVRSRRQKRRKMDCSSLLNSPKKHRASGRVFNQPLDPKANEKPLDEPSSPRKASRAARLKPQERTNTTQFDHDKKGGHVKTEREKGRFERKRLAEEKSKNKADKAAAKKKTKVELKKQREREREAARIALQKMERTAGIELNLEIYRELEILSGCSLSRGNPLHKLGLFIKQEYLGDDDEENLKVEHGEISSLRLKVVDGSRKDCPTAENCVTLTSQIQHSGERLSTPISDSQMSPKKASRAAMLKSRYANIIQKSQQQLDTAAPVKTQQEYEELERSLAEDKAKIREAEAAAKEKTRVELKKQRKREREREAARIALQKMERTAGIELNVEIFKELENLSGCSLSLGKPLHDLGLFIKQEYLGDEDDEEAILYELEEGEILP